MAKRKRRTRSSHPGVVLKKRSLPSGAVAWRARYTEPETGRERYVTLDALALPTREARAAWARQLAADLARRRMDSAAGVEPAPEPVEIARAIDDYLAAGAARLRPATINAYRQSLSRLLRWSAQAGVATTAQLGPAELADLRDALISAGRSAPVAGARRGARRARAERRSVPTINSDLRAIKAMLGDLRRRGRLPGLHRDDIADALQALPAPRDEPPFLAPADLGKLIAAAVRHDAKTYDETREEHRGERPRGSTPRFAPMAPLVAFLLLSGCRAGEALSLRWSSVDLDALDHEGRRVGEIRLRASGTKTHRGRTIGLEVSPALRRLLASMRLRTGGAGFVFGGNEPYTAHQIKAARIRLMRDFGAPAFDWQTLRSTCATYLTNAPGIFGAATAFLSAKQLGHSVAVAERHYLGVHRGIPREARTLEAAMQIEGELGALIDGAHARVA